MKNPSTPGTISIGDTELKCQALYTQYLKKGTWFPCSNWAVSVHLKKSVSQLPGANSAVPLLLAGSWWSCPHYTTASGLKGLQEQLGISSTERVFWIRSFLSRAAMTLKSSIERRLLQSTATWGTPDEKDYPVCWRWSIPQTLQLAHSISVYFLNYNSCHCSMAFETLNCVWISWVFTTVIIKWRLQKKSWLWRANNNVPLQFLCHYSPGCLRTNQTALSPRCKHDLWETSKPNPYSSITKITRAQLHKPSIGQFNGKKILLSALYLSTGVSRLHTQHRLNDAPSENFHFCNRQGEDSSFPVLQHPVAICTRMEYFYNQLALQFPSSNKHTRKASRESNSPLLHWEIYAHEKELKSFHYHYKWTDELLMNCLLKTLLHLCVMERYWMQS